MKKSNFGILLLAALACGSDASAASHVSRCVTSDGGSTYTDGSCRAIGGTPVPMSANLMRNLAREGVLGGDDNFRKTSTPRRASGGPASADVRNRLGGASCPRTPAELAAALRDSLGDGEVSQLASLYDWTGKSSRQAQPILKRLERMSDRPLIDGQYFAGGLSPDSGGTVQLIQGAQNAPTITEVAVTRRAGCLLLNL